MKHFKPTLSIATSAFNEEANIKNLLESISMQKEKGFKIKEIIVLSDGSTDKTAERAKEVVDPRIRILDYKKRMGKSYHLNTFPKIVNSDILVLFDADVVLENELVVAKLILPLIKGKSVGLVSGNFQPTEVKTFLQKAIKCTINVFEILRKEHKGGNNPFGCTGRIMAMSKPFYRVLHVPPTMVLNDIYTYFDCLNNGFNFRYVVSAKVYYQLPSNLKDYLSQFKRFCVGSARMSEIFGSLYEKEYAIPKKRFYALMLKEFLKKPIHCIFIYLLNFIGRQISKGEIEKMDAKWEVVSSTKKLSPIC